MAVGLLVYDLLYFGLAGLLFSGSWAAGAAVARLGLAGDPGLVVAGLVWTAALLAGLLALIAQIAVLTALLPRLRPGRYPMMKGPVFWSWLLRSLLRRYLWLPPIRTVVLSSNVLRFLALRALGARVAFTASMSNDVDLLDPALLRVDRGAMLGTRTLISGHYVAGGRLVLGEVHVGEGSLLAAEVMIGPGARIGEGASVDSRAVVGVDAEVGAGARVGGATVVDNRAVVPPGARLEKGIFFRGAEPAEGEASPGREEMGSEGGLP